MSSAFEDSVNGGRPAIVECQTREIGVFSHVRSLDVDGRLPSIVVGDADTGPIDLVVVTELNISSVSCRKKDEGDDEEPN